MGARGPKKTPTAILKLKGSWQAKHRPDVQEQAEMPDAPAWLSGKPLAAWKELAPVLLSKGVLTIRDANALARYCQLFVRWREAEDFMDRHSAIIPVMKGGKVIGTKPHAYARLALGLSAQLEKLEADFGMNPAARADIMTPKEKAPIETRQRSG